MSVMIYSLKLNHSAQESTIKCSSFQDNPTFSKILQSLTSLVEECKNTQKSWNLEASFQISSSSQLLHPLPTSTPVSIPTSTPVPLLISTPVHIPTSVRVPPTLENLPDIREDPTLLREKWTSKIIKGPEPEWGDDSEDQGENEK